MPFHIIFYFISCEERSIIIISKFHSRHFRRTSYERGDVGSTEAAIVSGLVCAKTVRVILFQCKNDRILMLHIPSTCLTCRDRDRIEFDCGIETFAYMKCLNSQKFKFLDRVR